MRRRTLVQLLQDNLSEIDFTNSKGFRFVFSSGIVVISVQGRTPGQTMAWSQALCDPARGRESLFAGYMGRRNALEEKLKRPRGLVLQSPKISDIVCVDKATDSPIRPISEQVCFLTLT